MDTAAARISLIPGSDLTEARLAEFGRFVAARNADPRQHIGYVGTEPEEVTADLREIEGERVFAAAESDAGLCGLLCAEWDLDIGRTWLYGPWADGADLMDRLYAAVRPLVPAGAAQHELYCDADNRAVVDFAERHDFPHQGRHVVMGFARERLDSLPPVTLPALTPDLHEQFAALHDGAFPGTYAPAAVLLAEKPRVYVVVDDGTLRGYITIKLRPEFAEAQIKFIAVADSARGQGIGARLVTAGLHAAFADPRIASVDLVTSNPAARRLYDRVGFTVRHEMRSFRTATAPAAGDRGL
jgi:ribosomal protein S18 acetylase RimI-like enzyme